VMMLNCGAGTKGSGAQARLGKAADTVGEDVRQSHRILPSALDHKGAPGAGPGGPYESTLPSVEFERAESLGERPCFIRCERNFFI
jgi:hypothetical protein